MHTSNLRSPAEMLTLANSAASPLSPHIRESKVSARTMKSDHGITAFAAQAQLDTSRKSGAPDDGSQQWQPGQHSAVASGHSRMSKQMTIKQKMQMISDMKKQ